MKVMMTSEEVHRLAQAEVAEVIPLKEFIAVKEKDQNNIIRKEEYPEYSKTLINLGNNIYAIKTEGHNLGEACHYDVFKSDKIPDDLSRKAKDTVISIGIDGNNNINKVSYSFHTNEEHFPICPGDGASSVEINGDTVNILYIKIAAYTYTYERGQYIAEETYRRITSERPYEIEGTYVQDHPKSKDQSLAKALISQSNNDIKDIKQLCRKFQLTHQSENEINNYKRLQVLENAIEILGKIDPELHNKILREATENIKKQQGQTSFEKNDGNKGIIR